MYTRPGVNSLPGGINVLESIPGLLKPLQIRPPWLMRYQNMAFQMVDCHGILFWIDDHQKVIVVRSKTRTAWLDICTTIYHNKSRVAQGKRAVGCYPTTEVRRSNYALLKNLLKISNTLSVKHTANRYVVHVHSRDSNSRPPEEA